EYPETYLLASTIYATSNNVVNLKQNLNYIRNNYSKWQIPLFWSVVILSTNANYQTIVDITQPYVLDNVKPDISIQNIYIGALLASKQLDIANNYLNNQAKINDTPNVELNLGIIAAINKDYVKAIKYLSPLQLSNTAFNNLINIYLGLLADYKMQYHDAVNYYGKVTNNLYLDNIANTMMVHDYTRLKDQAKVEGILDKIVQDKNLTGVDSILFKAHSYISAYDNDSAYKLLKTNFKLYNKNPDYIYLYASILAVTHHTKEAINMYNYYIKLVPKSEYGYNDLAYVYIEQTSQYKFALKYAKKAASINITDYNVMDTLGWVYYKMGDYVKAYPLINSSYQTMQTEDGAKHLKAVLNALNKPRLADTIIVTNKDLINIQVNKMMADKMLGLLILLQYGVVGIGLGFE
ncbi:MAG: hypothetical protein K2P99_04060, partial [Burkholderiales bacterium]|nr:hypothetical protein [Burkholderiales bacterium]